MNSYKQSGLVFLLTDYIKNWKLFALSFVLCIGLAGLYLMLKNPEYKVNANVLIKEDSKSGGLASAMMKSVPFGDVLSVGGSVVDDEIEVISSYSILRGVVKDLGLNANCSKGFLKKKNYYKDSPLTVTPKVAGMADTLRYAIEMEVSIDKEGVVNIEAYSMEEPVGEAKSVFPVNLTTIFGDFIIDKTSYYDPGKTKKYKLVYGGYGSATESLMSRVDISVASKKANVINLTMEDEIPERGKDILNAIISHYNAYGIDEKNLVSERTAVFLQQRIDIMEKDLNAIEKAVEKYKEDNQLTDIESEAKIILDRSSDFKERLISAETQFSVISIIEDFLKAPENKYAVVPMSLGIEEESAVESLLAYNDLLMERLKLLRSTKPGNPMIESMNEQVDATRQSVLMTIQSIKRGIEYARDDLRDQEKYFMDRIKGMPKQEREYIEIKRQQEIKQALYLYLLQQQEDNALKLAMENPKAQIIDNAYVKTRPVKPMKMLVAAAALLFAVIMPVFYLYAKKMLARKFQNAQELRSATSLVFSGNVHHSDKDFLFSSGDGEVEEDIRTFRSVIYRALDNDVEHKAVVVSSVMKGEGKTFVALNLALSMALLDKKILLIDANLRNSSLSSMPLSSEAQLSDGLAQIVQGNVDWRMVVRQSSSASNLHIMPAGVVQSNASELLLNAKFHALLDELKAAYDFIVIDAANLYDYSDTMPLFALSDMAILVTRANHSDKASLEYVETLVEQRVISNYVYVVNDVKSEAKH